MKDMDGYPHAAVNQSHVSEDFCFGTVGLHDAVSL